MTCLLLWTTSFPTFALYFHDFSYVGLSLLAKMFFIKKFFPSLGTLEELALEDFFPSFSFIRLSSISSTSLLISLFLHPARHWDYTMWSFLRVWSLFMSGGIIYPYISYWSWKNSKKIHIWCWKNPKKHIMSWKNEHPSENLAIGAFDISPKNLYISKIQKIRYCKNTKK